MIQPSFAGALAACVLACAGCKARHEAPAAPAASGATVVATSQAASSVTLVYDDCPRLLSDSSSLAGEAAETRALGEVLAGFDPQHGDALLRRLPRVFIAWMDGQPAGLRSLGLAVHETSHVLDAALSGLCADDPRARFFLDGQVFATDLKPGDSENASIAASAVPAAFRQDERYRTYVEGAAAWNGNDFRALLEEFNAYAGAALTEIRLLSAPACERLCPHERLDTNLAGMLDLMLYTESYLKAARERHPQTLARLAAQPATRAHLQRLWWTAEALLAAAYRFSSAADPAHGLVEMPAATLEAVYADDMLAELDRLGIHHAPRSKWLASYLETAAPVR